MVTQTTSQTTFIVSPRSPANETNPAVSDKLDLGPWFAQAGGRPPAGSLEHGPDTSLSGGEESYPAALDARNSISRRPEAVTPSPLAATMPVVLTLRTVPGSAAHRPRLLRRRDRFIAPRLIQGGIPHGPEARLLLTLLLLAAAR
jgi:hypothetical protein